MVNPDDIKLILKATVTANPLKMTVRDLEIDFIKHEGCSIPFREMGFRDLESYLKSIPDALVVVGSGMNAEVRVVVGEKSAHIVNMISKQKNNTKNIGMRARRIPFNSNVNLDSSSSNQQPYNSGRFSNSYNYKQRNNDGRNHGKTYQNSFPKKTAVFPMKGQSLQRNDVPNPSAKLSVSRNAEGNLSLNAPDWKNLKNNCQMKSSPAHFNTSQLLSNVPIPQSANFGNLLDQASSSSAVPTNSVTNSSAQVLPENQPLSDLPIPDRPLTISNVQNSRRNQQSYLSSTNTSTSNSDVQKLPENPDLKKVPTPRRFPIFSGIKNMPGLTVCSDKIKKCKVRDVVDDSSPSSSGSSDLDNKRKTGAIPKQSSPEMGNGSSYNEINYKIPRVLQKNLEKLIAEHPAGVWCAYLPVLYKQKYGCELNYVTYGYKALIQMCSDLHYIFHHKLAPKGDFKLYSKKNPIPEDDPDLLDFPLKFQEHSSLLMQTKDALPPLTNQTWTFSSCMYPPDVVMKGEILPKEILEVAVGDYVDIRIGEIYDPSKFWFYLNQNEWRLNKLMDDMQDFYDANHKQLAIPKIMVQQHLYCVTMFMNEFHRAIICKLLPLTPSKVKVFFVDYGTVSVVTTDNLYFLHNDFKGLPEQAIRGRLAKIYPPYKKTQWSLESSDRFLQLVFQKTLVAQIDRIDEERNAFELLISDDSGENNIYINDSLVFEGHAIFTHQQQGEINIKPGDYPIVKYLHLFPTFEEIEMGLVASTHEMLTLQTLGIPLSSLYPQYYKEFKDRPQSKATDKTDSQSPTGNKTFLNENVQNFFNQDFPRAFYAREENIIKHVIMNKCVHIILYNQLAYVSVEEIQKLFLGKVFPIITLRRKFAFGHFITLENISLKDEIHMKETLIRYKLMEKRSNCLDIMLLKYLPDFLKELSDVSMDVTEIEELIEMYDHTNMLW